MACEQNATHLKYCKEKGSTVEMVTLTPESTTTQLITSKRPALGRQTFGLRNSVLGQEMPKKSAAFESTRISHQSQLPVVSSNSMEPSVPEDGMVDSETEEPNWTTSTTSTTSMTMSKKQRPHPLSSTTLIPPSLFVEPTIANLVIDNFPTPFDQIVALASSLSPPSTSAPTTTSTSTSTTTTSATTANSNPSTEPSTTLANLHLALTNEPEVMPEHRETTIHMEPIPSSLRENQTQFLDFFLEKPTSTKSSELLVSTSKPLRPNPTSNFHQTIKDLDMSNFEINNDGQFPTFLSPPSKQSNSDYLNSLSFYENTFSGLKPTSTAADTAANKSPAFTMSQIHKFFRESLPTSYLKNVPKILRTLNSNIRDFEALSSTAYGESLSPPIKSNPTMPRSAGSANLATSDDDSSSSSAAGVSMLSIPVLVPVNLSPEDYRRRISASVLKPIVIPLKEKGKLIPAYVLHFGSRRTRRHKRSALNGKRLLSLSIKPNLLYQVIPSLLKNVYTKSGKQHQGKPHLASPHQKKPTFEMLMAQAAMMAPLYAMPNGKRLPSGQMAQMLKFAAAGVGGAGGGAGGGGMPYDLTDYKYFIPPYYFIDQHPYLHHHLPKGAAKMKHLSGVVFKRPPLRSKIPFGPLNGTMLMGGGNGTGVGSTSTPSTASSSGGGGLLAVGSSPTGLAVSTPIPSPLLYGGGLGHLGVRGLLPKAISTTTTHQTPTFPSFALPPPGMSPLAAAAAVHHGHRHPHLMTTAAAANGGGGLYSPLLYFGNTFLGTDPAKFKPMLKKATLLRSKQLLHSKLHSKNAFNSKPQKEEEEEKLSSLSSSPPANEATASNITAPANIYVPDEILGLEDDVPLPESGASAAVPATQQKASNLSELFEQHQLRQQQQQLQQLQNTIDHKVSNDLADNITGDESRPVEVFARRHTHAAFSIGSGKNNRAMRGGGGRSMATAASSTHHQRELSPQAKINANFFNGTAVKVNKGKPSPASTATTAVNTETSSKGQSHKVPRDSRSGSSSSYHRIHEVSKSAPAYNSGEAYGAENGSSSSNSDDQPADDISDRGSDLTSYLRHLKATVDTVDAV